MDSSALVWESLLRTDRTVVTSEDLARLAARLDKDPAHVVRHLRRAGYLLPLFKGYYYVRSPEEVRLDTPRYNSLELFALAADAKGIGTWYLGLHTALHLNGMTHEDRREATVISDALYRIEGVAVGKRRFVIHKWAGELLTFGVVKRGLVRFSDPEKTVLDLAYGDHWREAKGHAPTGTWTEHVNDVDVGTLHDYLCRYPDSVRAMVEDAL